VGHVIDGGGGRENGMMMEEEITKKIERKGRETTHQEKGTSNRKLWEQLVACFPSILHGPHIK
jgi:predicted Holliday junction resolvase-like endonuclease